MTRSTIYYYIKRGKSCDSVSLETGIYRTIHRLTVIISRATYFFVIVPNSAAWKAVWPFVCDITACCSAQFTKGWLPGEFSKISQPLLSRTGDRNNKYHHVAGSSFVEDSWNDLKRRSRVDKRFRRENDLSSVVGYKMPFKIECRHLRCYVTLVLQISFTCIVKLLRRTRRIIRKIDVYV